MGRRLPVLVLLVSCLALTASSLAAAAPNDRADDRAHERHDEIASYWTAERRAAAKPAFERLRKVPLAKGGNPGKPDKPGGDGGDGGGGGGPAPVTGAPWTASDPVQIQVGKVFFTTAEGNWQCSGGVIDSPGGSLVVTAGHCLHDGDGGPFVWNWAFIPGYEDLAGEGWGEDVYGTWTATWLFTTPGWAASSDFNVDVGFALVTNGNGATLESAVGDAPAGSFDGTARGTFVHLFGYPAGGAYAPGRDLVYCAGDADRDKFGSSARGVVCDMTGGSSGGSWYEDFGPDRVVSSVNSFKYTAGPQRDRMFGPQFGSVAETAYLQARDGSCDGGELCASNAAP